MNGLSKNGLDLFNQLGISTPVAGILFFLLVIWALVWKGLALWKSARLGSKPWFIILLIVNTLGILEILYIYVFSKKSKSSPPPTNNPS